ncbi:hypothetical protein IMZ31_23450 (plasmid) [Pontibacillus sp. ALD_SL1]|uniref:helix-turn-helix domain-containing protein n=1 Tax=Pontibacillus sp. ALD_SL1 TaxID=2777185 RepID=UPI001A9767EC|nr:helix-turn-helix domain-containing protein [Pontibacillus sp. ALD_SL1]QST02409.1 hypothetical protein IMZ31_23450 [Pontibacillus sp. ALD_SL1]
MNIQDVFTFTEAVEIWGLNHTMDIEDAIRYKKLDHYETKRSGEVGLITRKGMEKLFGKEPYFRRMQCVKRKGEDTNGFGIAYEILHKPHGNPSYNIMFADMDEDFGVWETPEYELESLTPKEVEAHLAYIRENQKEFAPFVMQLNDLGEVFPHHILEDEEMKRIRQRIEKERQHA